MGQDKNPSTWGSGNRTPGKQIRGGVVPIVGSPVDIALPQPRLFPHEEGHGDARLYPEDVVGGAGNLGVAPNVRP